MNQGTRVVNKVKANGGIFSATNYDIFYDDGTHENVSGSSFFMPPNVGDVEYFDSFGTRTGWGPAHTITTSSPILPSGVGSGNISSSKAWISSHSHIQSTLGWPYEFEPDVKSMLKSMGVQFVNPYKGTCSKCQDESDIVFNYKIFDIPRCLCKSCVVGVMDKFFGLSNNVATEKALYDKQRNDNT